MGDKKLDKQPFCGLVSGKYEHLLYLLMAKVIPDITCTCNYMYNVYVCLCLDVHGHCISIYGTQIYLIKCIHIST